MVIQTPWKFHFSSSNNFLDTVSRCKWSTIAGEPLLYLKYGWNELNILDIEKKKPTLKESVKIEKKGCNLNQANDLVY